MDDPHIETQSTDDCLWSIALHGSDIPSLCPRLYEAARRVQLEATPPTKVMVGYVTTRVQDSSIECHCRAFGLELVEDDDYEFIHNDCIDGTGGKRFHSF
jgi:hypothetical protein